MAHVKDPAIQGFVAMAGVFVDTILICSSTAFVIMLTGAYQGTDLKSVAITQEAFSRAFGSGGVTFLAIALFFFAFTTIMGWYMFGEMNVRYLFGKYGVLPFRLIVCGCIFCHQRSGVLQSPRWTFNTQIGTRIGCGFGLG